MSNIFNGQVIKWVSKHGYGYIRYFDHGEDKTIYVHNSSTKERRLYKGMVVSFTCGVNERGAIAENVEVISNAKVKKDSGAKG